MSTKMKTATLVAQLMKKPDEEKLTKMYGQNEDRKKAYRKGWETVGNAIKAEKDRKKEKVKYQHK